jgi:hypothetical protein
MGFFSSATRFGIPGVARGLFGGGRSGGNPADAGMGYLNQIPGAVQPYYQPFIESGRQAESMTNPIYERMSRSPGAFIEELMQGYTPSRGYRFKQEQMERSMRNDASHGGFVGTPYSQQQQGELTQGLLSQDMQEFLANLLGVQGSGLAGQESRIERGHRASTGYGDIVGSNLAQQGFLASQGRAQQMSMDQARSNARRQFLSNLIGSGASFMGGGGGVR